MALNTFETILLQALVSGESLIPAFVSSPKATIYVNVSEEFVNSLVQAGITKSVSVPTTIAPAPAPQAPSE
jgi:hypothetical protein